MSKDTDKPNDTVYYLGYFCFGGYEKYKYYLEQLNGKIIFHKGNHDKGRVLKKLHREGYFEELHMLGSYMKIRSPKTKTRYQLNLCHYPIDTGYRPRIFSLHGHIHGSQSKMLNQVNLCVDSPLNFGREFGKPISEEELINYLDYINPKIEEKFHREREALKNLN